MTLNLFGQQEPSKVMPLKNRSGSFNINPCIAVFGAGPDGTRCKDCQHLRSKEGSKTFYKCALRTITNGPATDHKVNWPTCAKYERSQTDGGLEINEADLAAIKAELVSGKRITVDSVIETVGTHELRTYIPRLRKEGLEIDTEWINGKKKRYKEYFLAIAS